MGILFPSISFHPGVPCKGYFKDHMPATSSSVLALHVFWTSLVQTNSGSKADWVVSYSSKPCSAGTAMQLKAEGPSESTLRAPDFECAKIKAAENWNLYLHHPKAFITLPFSLPWTATGMPTMAKAVIFAFIFFVGHSETARSRPWRSCNEGKSSLSFFHEILALAVRLSGTGLILHKVQLPCSH